MFVTFAVFNELRSRLSRLLQPLNIPSMFVTFEVFILSKPFMFVKLLPENM